MSDVSKTNELIEQLRAFGKADFMGESGAPGFRLLWDASDALESATRVPEQGEASVAFVRRALEGLEQLDLNGPTVRDGTAWGSILREAKADLATALDGAPEPETAPENYEPKCNGACVVHGSPVTNWPVQYGRRHRETGALHWLKGDPFDSWWHGNQDSYEHVKRYTSPPLPVEGESAP